MDVSAAPSLSVMSIVRVTAQWLGEGVDLFVQFPLLLVHSRAPAHPIEIMLFLLKV